jgi:hypothetical protein
VNSAADERERLVALLAALDDPARAAALSPDDPLLVALARHHRLTPLLSITCGATLPPSLAETFRRDRVITAARNMLLGRAAEECIQAFTSAGIPTIILKGLDYETRLYAAPAARPTGDVDLLVPGDKRRAAFEVLDRLGFEPRAAAPGFDEPDYHEVAWTRGGLEVDLHLALAPLVRNRIDHRAIWADAEPLHLGDTETRVLSAPHAVIFHTVHMAIDHFDVPAIYLVDLSLLLDRVSDPLRLRSLAAAWRCARPLSSGLALLGALLSGRTRHLALERSRLAQRVIMGYGSTAALPRREQLVRKLAHFDGVADVVRYVATQTRRNVREQVKRRFGRRSARERLRLPNRP